MSAVVFDAIKYLDELVKAGVPEAQAKAQLSALTHVIEDVVGGTLATKSDVKEAEIRLIKWVVSANIATVTVLFALLKLL